MEKLLNNFKISYPKGDTYALAVKIKNITDDLSTAYFTVKENPEDEPLIQKSLGAGIDKIDDRAYKNEKTYKIQLQSEDTAYLEPLVQYLYDFRITVGNVVKTLLSGVFVVSHSITEVSTTSTSTLEVAIDDVIESEVNNTGTTSGIEYEQDPVAMKKIGDITTLETTAKSTIVDAVNEVNANNTATDKAVQKIIDGETTVPNAKKINGVEITQDANGVLKVGDIIIPQKKLIWSGSVSSSAITTGVISLGEDIQENDCIEIEWTIDIGSFNGKSRAIVKLDSYLNFPTVGGFVAGSYKYTFSLLCKVTSDKNLEIYQLYGVAPDADKYGSIVTLNVYPIVTKVYKIIE